ncbi:MAG: YdcF family protein [Myxococcota bacterium]
MFVLSKLAWLLLEPAHVLVLLLCVGVVLQWRNRVKAARVTLSVVALGFLLPSVLPLGRWIAGALEDRFSPPATEERVDGVVVLGGAVNAALSEARGQVSLNEAAERVTTLVELARRYPDATLVFTGGIGSLRRDFPPEAQVVPRFLAAMGMDPARVIFEDQSRNTHENAVLTFARVRPTTEQRWLLVTSAMHMPRAMGTFRRAGWNVVAYPVDYATDGSAGLRPGFSVLGGLAELTGALKEVAGLMAYRILGRTDALFPAP